MTYDFICEHCGKPERFRPFWSGNVLCSDCEELVCLKCKCVECACMKPLAEECLEIMENMSSKIVTRMNVGTIDIPNDPLHEQRVAILAYYRGTEAFCLLLSDLPAAGMKHGTIFYVPAHAVRMKNGVLGEVDANIDVVTLNDDDDNPNDTTMDRLANIMAENEETT